MNVQASTGIVAFTGYNTRAVVAFCRFLRSRGLRAHLIAKNKADPIFLTEFTEWVFQVRDSEDLQIAQCLVYFSALRFTFHYASLLVLPTSEYLNRFFLARRQEFRLAGVDIPLVEAHLYQNISDKHSFRTICMNYGFNTPRALGVKERSFPFVAKKVRYESGSGLQAKPYFIFSEEDYQSFCRNEPTAEFFLEEYLYGESHYLLYHISKGGVALSFSQQNLIQQAKGRSIVAARVSDAHICVIGTQYAQLLVSLGFYGLVMIEVRKCNGHYYMIEANPRMWGPLQFVVDNCPRLLEEFLHDQGIQFENANFTGVHDRTTPKSYFWYGGYVSDRLSGRSPMFHGYEQEAMNEELHVWLASDVFLQEDTIRLFKEEIAGNAST